MSKETPPEPLILGILTFFCCLVIFFFYVYPQYQFKKDCEYHGGYIFKSNECYIYTYGEFGSDPNYYYLKNIDFYYRFDSRPKNSDYENIYEDYREKSEFELKIQTDLQKSMSKQVQDIIETSKEILPLKK